MRDLIPRKEIGTMTNRLFSEFWNEFDRFLNPSDIFREGLRSTNKFSYPKLNIQDLEADYIVEAGVPGLTKDDVKVDYADGLLTISGTKQNEVHNDSNGYVVRELHKSSFARSIRLDEDVCNIEQIDASVENGVLKIKIPKKVLDKSEPKRIIEVK